MLREENRRLREQYAELERIAKSSAAQANEAEALLDGLQEQLEARDDLLRDARSLLGYPDGGDEFSLACRAWLERFHAASIPAISPESPCAICRSYGHFTHDHPDGYVNPMYDALDPASSHSTLDDRNPASVVGVPWNEDGYAGDSDPAKEPK